MKKHKSWFFSQKRELKVMRVLRRIFMKVIYFSNRNVVSQIIERKKAAIMWRYYVTVYVLTNYL